MAVALVDTVVDYKSVLCSVAYVEDPNADAAKIIKSLEHLLQHLNIDGCIRIMHHFVILNPTVLAEEWQRTKFLTDIPPGVSRIVKAILVAGSKPPVTTSGRRSNQPSNSADNCPTTTTHWCKVVCLVVLSVDVIVLLGLLLFEAKVCTPCPSVPPPWPYSRSLVLLPLGHHTQLSIVNVITAPGLLVFRAKAHSPCPSVPPPTTLRSIIPSRNSKGTD